MATAAALIGLGAAGAAAGRPLTLADLQRQATVTGAWAAPGGRLLVLETQAPYREAGAFDDQQLILFRLSRLWRIDVRRSRPQAVPIAPGAGVLPLALSPSGRRLAIARFEGRRLALGVLGLASGQIRWTGLYVRPPRAGPSVRWLDERRLAALSPLGAPEDATFPATLPGQTRLQRERLRQVRGELGVPSRAGSGRFAQPAQTDTRLIVLDVDGRRTRTLAVGAFDDLEPSPDGAVLALTAPDVTPPLARLGRLTMIDGLPRRRLFLCDTRSGRLTRVCPDCDLLSTLLAWAPRGDRLLVYARRDRDAAWEDGRYVLVQPGREGVEFVSTRDRVPGLDRLPGTSFPIARGGWDGDTPLLQLRRPADGASEVLRLAKGDFEPVAPGRPAHVVGGGVRARVSPDPEFLYARSVTGPQGVVLTKAPGVALIEHRDAHGVMRIVLRRSDGDHPLLEFNAYLADVALPTVRRLTRTADNGAIAHDLLFLPQAGPRRPPLIVAPYPGANRVDPPEFALLGTPPPEINPVLLTAKGYAVLIPGLPRSPQDEPAQRLVKDVTAATDAAVATGLVDGERAALWGESFGGHAVLVVAAGSQRYRAVIAQSAPTDFISLYGAFPGDARANGSDAGLREGQMGYLESGQGHMGAPPWRDVDMYVRNSPVFMAHRITAPVLLIDGEHDFFPPSQSEEMFSALRRGDQDAELLIFPGEGHVLMSPGARAAYLAAALAFLRRTLGAP